jgi:hypothetical protein
MFITLINETVNITVKYLKLIAHNFLTQYLIKSSFIANLTH